MRQSPIGGRAPADLTTGSIDLDAVFFKQPPDHGQLRAKGHTHSESHFGKLHFLDEIQGLFDTRPVAVAFFADNACGGVKIYNLRRRIGFIGFFNFFKIIVGLALGWILFIIAAPAPHFFAQTGCFDFIFHNDRKSSNIDYLSGCSFDVLF